MDFLMATLPHKSRNNIKSMLSHGEILVDNEVQTKYDHALTEGETVKIIRSINRDKSKKQVLDFIYEDDDLIVVNKPAGLLSIATDKEKDQTAYHLLLEYVRTANNKNRIFVVHRLDRDTSGVLMVAKNEKIKHALQDNWDKLVTKRGYMAVVEGRFDKDKKSDRITSWLNETKTHFIYSSYTKGDGQEAITNYSVVKEKGKFSLLDITIDTGRKNQIRVHMKDIGHSIVGDKKYGAILDPMKRLGLHAHILEFKHPFNGKIMNFEAKLPESFTSLFDK